MPALGLALTDQSRWPFEPEAPAKTAAAPFSAAMKQLCGGRLNRKRAQLYSRLILKYAQEFKVDPFLLGSIIYRTSRCAPTPRKGHRGGLIPLGYKAHARYFKGGAYHYWVLHEGSWQERRRPHQRFKFIPRELRRSEPSLYFAALLLAAYGEQCPDIDSRFGSVPHRHAVSHLIWGDKVVDAGSEDRILTDRRRLLGYYLGRPPTPVGSFHELRLFSPLDGAPRKITSGLGAIRGLAHHHHKGVDFESTRGEPVRAVADGQVIRAGVDLPRRGSIPLSPRRAAKFRRSRMGRGGLFVLIRHDPYTTTGYMHLDDVVVRDGQMVKGGQLIGTVGRTGIHRDPAHLHFELKFKHRPVNPAEHLGESVFPADATFLGRMIIAAQPRMWRKARYKKRRLRRLKKMKRKKSR